MICLTLIALVEKFGSDRVIPVSAKIESELAQRSEYEQTLSTAQAEMVIAEQQLSVVQDQIDVLTRAQEQSAGLQRKMDDLDTRLQQESVRLKRLEEDLEKLRERNEYYEHLFSRADNIKQKHLHCSSRTTIGFTKYLFSLCLPSCIV